MKKTLSKLLICICIVVTLFNFLILNLGTGIVYAEEAAEASTPLSQDEIKQKVKEEVEAKNNPDEEGGFVDDVIAVLKGIAGILISPTKLLPIIAAGIIQSLGGSVANMAGNFTAGEPIILLTPYHILFNKLVITDINFLDATSTEISGTLIAKVREQIALWYYVMRIIAIVILLGILIVVGIKMAITTVASEKAIFKKALFDWATSLALVFLLHYLIRAVIWINSAFVTVLDGIANDIGLDSFLGAMAGLMFEFNPIISWASILVYVIVTVQTLMFLISYIKRMLVIAFLIIISPLITITYSIDKMGDQKAQALNSWLKEFIYNILIQPFHCILYLAFVSVAIQALSSGSSYLAGALLAILAIKFVWDGEKIVRKIFGFEQASSLAAAAASGAVIGSVLSKAKSAGSAASSGIKFAKNSKTGQLLKQKASNFKDNSKNVQGLGLRDKFAYNKAKNRGDISKASSLEAKAHAVNLDKGNKRKQRQEKWNNTRIHEMAEKNRQKYNERKDKVKNSKFGQWSSDKYNKIKNSELAQAVKSDSKRFVRKITSPEKLAKMATAATIAAAMYALPDSNLVTAVGGGYAAGKSVERGVRNLRENKKEHFEENVTKAWDRHCDIKGIAKEDRTREKFNEWYQSTYLRGENDALNQKNIGKAQKEAEKDLGKLGLDPTDIDTIINTIQRAILSKQDYKPNELFEGYGVDSSEIAKAVEDFANKYNDQYTYNQAANYNEQMNQFGITADEALEGIPNSVFANLSTTPTTTETEVETNTDTIIDTTVTETEVIDNVEQDIDNAKIDVGADADPNVILSRLQDIINDRLITIENDMRTSLESIGSDQEGNLSTVINELNTKIDNMNLNSGNIAEQINGAVSSAMSNINLDEMSNEMQSQMITNIKRYATTRVENNYINNNNSGGGLDPNQIKEDLTKLLKNNK